MEVSLKMYWNPASNVAGGKSPYTIIKPAHYGDGTYLPLLARMEALESKLKLSVNDLNNIELRIKHITRHFLLYKVWYSLTCMAPENMWIYVKLKQICEEWAAEKYYKTAFESTGHTMYGPT
jgi:hypothetical protein